MKLKEKLLDYRIRNDMLVEIPEAQCAVYKQMLERREELPKGICSIEDYDGSRLFYSLSETEELSESEMNEYVLYMQLKSINTIKKCVIFFTVMTILGFTLAAIAAVVMIMGAI